MSLLSDLEAARNRGKGARCYVARLLDILPADEAAAVKTAIDAKLIDATVIDQLLTRNGHEIGAQNIARHRRGDCRCP